MPKTVKKYIESHWMIFVAKGIVALFAGFYLTFSNLSPSTLSATIGFTLVALGVIELLNAMLRVKRNYNWSIAIFVTFIELGVGLAMILTSRLPREVPLTILSAYTAFYGAFSIFSGFRDFSNLTNKFIFVFIGILGCIIGFSILGANLALSDTNFVKLFGTYLMLRGFGLTVYGVHSRDEKLIEKEARAKK